MSAIDCNPVVQRKKLSFLDQFLKRCVRAVYLLRGYVQGRQIIFNY
jgi:hypothetical protein